MRLCMVAGTDVYEYNYTPLFCPYRVLMADIFSIFRGYKLRLFRVDSDIFIIFRVHQVQLQKVLLNGNKKMGGSGVPRGLKKVY